MAGRPKFRWLRHTIAENGGDDLIFGMMLEGRTVADIGAQFGCSRNMIYDWIHDDDDRYDEFVRVRQIQAHSIMDEVEDLLEEGEEYVLDHPDQPNLNAFTSLRKERVNHKRQMAGKFNKKYFGEDKQGMSINLNMGDLHLSALQRYGAGPETKAIEAQDVELISDGEED